MDFQIGQEGVIARRSKGGKKKALPGSVGAQRRCEEGCSEDRGGCVLSFLLSMVAGGVSGALSTSGQPPPANASIGIQCGDPGFAEYLASLYIASLTMPSAGGAACDAPFDPRNPNSTPLPAPAATNHYPGLVEIRIQYLDDKDPTTRRMLESILAVEEEHADELADLLQDVPSGLKAKPRAAVK